MCSQLNWTQYKLFIAIPDDYKREYYELEAMNNCWTARELERQINSQLYERLLLSNDKESVLAVARKERIPQQPQEIIKDPMVLEFLGLERKAEYYEKDLEQALITHLQKFLLELGNGFTFVARQKRILIEDDEFFADLVFYNRLLRCFCAGAIAWSQMGRVVYGAEDEKRGYHRYAPGVMHPKTEVVSGVCADEATALMKKFFAGKGFKGKVTKGINGY